MNIAICLLILAIQRNYIGAQNHEECATSGTLPEKGGGMVAESKPSEKKIVGEAVKSTYAPFQVRLLSFASDDPKKPKSGLAGASDNPEKVFEGGLACGGTIISKRHILTASNCVGLQVHGHRPKPIDLKRGGAVYVIFGLLNWCPAWEEVKKNPKGPWKNVLLAEKITLHDQYDYPTHNMENDIAIVTVRHPVGPLW